MSEPRTEAGRTLLAWDNDEDDADERMRELLGGNRHWSMIDVIPAIEAEAARAAVEARDRELREAVEALRGVTLLVEKATGFGGSVIERDAVLRLLDAG